MNTELIVEDAFSISPKDILKNVHPMRKINSKANINRFDISYWMDDSPDAPGVFISAGGKEPQRFDLEWTRITYGQRAYFRCSCGSRVSKLYLPIRGNLFGCRKCHKLQYFLTTLNKNSVAGMKLYKMNRLQKLSNSRANMSRILYNGNFSKRFERFLRLCGRAGFDNVINSANDLRALIK